MSILLSRDEAKERIREAADIAQVIGECVQLRRTGSRLTGLCPFHSEKTPSFSVNPQGRFFHCFGCGEHGDVFAFVMKYHHMEFPEALQFLAKRTGIALPERQLSEKEREQLRRRELLYEAGEMATRLFQECLHHPRQGQVARRYLEGRGVPRTAVDRYRLGCAPSPEQAGWSWLTDQLLAAGMPSDVLLTVGLTGRNDRGGLYDRFRSRIMFPLLDLTGRVAGFGGRILDDGKPKYMNSPESPIFDKSRLLFGLHPHREAIRKARRVLVVEGNFDLLLLAVHGVDNVVAPLGTALTRRHIQSLRGFCDEAVVLFDADTAGRKAAMRSVPFFLAEQMEARVALLPEGHDPDSFVRAEGAEGVQGLVERARPLAEFLFDSLVREHGLTLAGKNRIVGELKPLLDAAADAEQRALMASHFGAKLGLGPDYFRSRPRRVRRESPVVPAVAPEAEMSRQEKTVLDFLFLYPEYHAVLSDAGLREVLRHPAALRLLDQVEPFIEGADSPEALLDRLDDEEAQAYIVGLLTRGRTLVQIPDPEGARRMSETLAAWLRREVLRRQSAALQEQIVLAEREGDFDRVTDLLRQKMDLQGKKRSP
ncbi:MAG: DNA primase [Desulfobulbus sp.]|jgi:DNA primase